MSDPEETFYTEDRWGNWIDRISEESLDPEEEESARLLLNMQDDTAIAVAKIVRAFANDRIDEDRATGEIDDIAEIALEPAPFDSEDKEMLVAGVQQSLEPVLYTAREYVLAGTPEEGTVTEYIDAARDAEADEDPEAAMGYVVQAGTLVVDGAEIPHELSEELEFGFVSEWVNGLESLQSAMADPEVVEED
jgi:Uncharacterized protein conserved in archaea